MRRHRYEVAGRVVGTAWYTARRIEVELAEIDDALLGDFIDAVAPIEHDIRTYCREALLADSPQTAAHQADGALVELNDLIHEVLLQAGNNISLLHVQVDQDMRLARAQAIKLAGMP